MIIDEIRNYISEENNEATIFNIPSYDHSIVGITEDGRIIYNYDSMIREFMSENNVDMQEAIDFVEYNTIQSIPHIEESVRPIIIFHSEIIEAMKEGKLSYVSDKKKCF